MDVAIITIAVIVIHVWRTMMEEIHRCQHLFTENDLDVATGDPAATAGEPIDLLDRTHSFIFVASFYICL